MEAMEAMKQAPCNDKEEDVAAAEDAARAKAESAIVAAENT